MQVKVQSHSIQTDKPLREEKPHYTSLIMNETGSHFFHRQNVSLHFQTETEGGSNQGRHNTRLGNVKACLCAAGTG